MLVRGSRLVFLIPHVSDSMSRTYVGKGTLTTRLVSKYSSVENIATGNLLRAHVQSRTEIGRAAEAVMAAGGILDDELMLQLVSAKLEERKVGQVRDLRFE